MVMKKALDTRTKSIISATLAFIFASTLTSSIFIGFAFSTLFGAATMQYFKQRQAKRSEQLAQVWPEVIDHIVSGLYSGLSISEALSDLAFRGPEITRSDFAEFNRELRSGIEFSSAINNLRNNFAHHGSDQIFEALPHSTLRARR